MQSPMQIFQIHIEYRKIAKFYWENRQQFLYGEMAIKISLERREKGESIKSKTTT